MAGGDGPGGAVGKRLAQAARHLKDGRPEAAARLCLGIVERAPGNGAAWSLLGAVRVAQKRHADALGCYGKAVVAAPDSAEAHNNLGAMRQLGGESRRAAECFRRAVALKPDYAQAHCNLGVALRKLGRLDEAVACQRRAIEIAPDYAKAYYNLGNALKEACEAEAAVRAYEQALARDPEHAEAHNNLGTVLESRGRAARARAEFSRAMALDGGYVEAHYNFALLHRFEAGDPLLAKLRHLHGAEGQSPGNRNRLAFVLAKAQADLGDHDGAFALYARANAQRRRRLSYDGAAVEEETAAIIAANSARRESAPRGQAGRAPIPLFILGLSRSGKSLVESVLAARADVFAAGESEHWRRLLRAATEGQASRAAPPPLGEQYRREMRRLAGGARFMVSTLDSNILSLGEIAAALPEARFVHCLREPLDTALSIYFKRYEQGHAYAYDVADIAHYMAQRAKLRRHWSGLYGTRILTLEYEKLVRDGTAAAARLSAHCGIEFDSSRALPRFHEDEIGVWKCYEKYIQPLREALAANGEQPAEK